jgi:hypothetical protein
MQVPILFLVATTTQFPYQSGYQSLSVSVSVVQQYQREGWTALGGVASIEAGTSIYLLQAKVR